MAHGFPLTLTLAIALVGCASEPDQTPLPGTYDTGDQREPTDCFHTALGGTSGGSGGADHPRTQAVEIGGVSAWLHVPQDVASIEGVPLLVVISGTEGDGAMLANLESAAMWVELSDVLFVALDGRNKDATEAAEVVNGVRALYDVDNDRTWLLSQSVGTQAGLELAFHVQPTCFAAYWANDVIDSDTPSLDAEALGFAPWGNAGPGGDWEDAEIIVDGMREAGWRLPDDAPYSGPGSDEHGSGDQFLEALEFFHDKVRAPF